MNTENLFIAVLFFIWGGISILKPQYLLNLKRWMAHKIYGAEYKPTKKTENIQRLMGVAFIIAALIITDIL